MYWNYRIGKRSGTLYRIIEVYYKKSGKKIAYAEFADDKSNPLANFSTPEELRWTLKHMVRDSRKSVPIVDLDAWDKKIKKAKK